MEKIPPKLQKLHYLFVSTIDLAAHESIHYSLLFIPEKRTFYSYNANGHGYEHTPSGSHYDTFKFQTDQNVNKDVALKDPYYSSLRLVICLASSTSFVKKKKVSDSLLIIYMETVDYCCM